MHYTERFVDVSIQITMEQDPDKACRLVREAILQFELVDRVAIFVRDAHLSKGTWGTDHNGCLRDEHHKGHWFPVDHLRDMIEQAERGDETVFLDPTPLLRLENGDLRTD